MKKIFYIIAICSVFVSCSKKDDPEPTPSAPVLNYNSTPQFSVSLNGTGLSMIADGSTIESLVGSSNSLNPVPNISTGNYSYYIGSNVNDIGIFLKRGGLLFMGFPPSDSLFLSFFPTGSYNYTSDGVNGISISYFDANGILWSTDLGTAVQTGSTFTIDERQGQDILGYYSVRYKASFSCKLYDGSGNTIDLTNGVIVGSFENI
ncbi:MAG: hypothetical protein IPP27_06575 [Bacteroidetes bacterium]|nr:hypothetical protein [Bacteroidota bacterium]MBK9412237.1 hypothetical protein [Bacteroidota bacterium]MBL0031854.1 hypothetical protein [Bacteroidota bacterium]